MKIKFDRFFLIIVFISILLFVSFGASNNKSTDFIINNGFYVKSLIKLRYKGFGNASGVIVSENGVFLFPNHLLPENFNEDMLVAYYKNIYFTVKILKTFKIYDIAVGKINGKETFVPIEISSEHFSPDELIKNNYPVEILIHRNVLENIHKGNGIIKGLILKNDGYNQKYLKISEFKYN